MRRSRRGSRGVEFPSSGEDSFVAVVVTKLTGALLFILLLTMVIMALLPRAVDTTATERAADSTTRLEIATPSVLPEAIAGRPYTLALAATGATKAARWSVVGELPPGLALDAEHGRITGTPVRGLSRPLDLTLIVTDGARRATGPARLVVYEPSEPLALASPWMARRTQVALRSWLENGFGFLVLLLVHSVGMSALGHMESRSSLIAAGGAAGTTSPSPRRFLAYRLALRVATLGALATLTLWLARPLHG
jgi:hypothetical protein